MRQPSQHDRVMAALMGVMVLGVLALLYIPALRPPEEVLACDRSGGVWLAETGTCREADSPLAGMPN